MRALLVLVVLAAVAHAEPRGAAWLHYELTGLRDVDDTAGTPAVRDFVLAGARLHGLVGGDRFAYHAGFDITAGATVQGGGFAYDVALLPFGFGVRFAGSSLVALGAGFGAMGATGTLDAAATFPVELTLEAGTGPVRLLARGRVAYVAAARGREHGSPSAPFGDELEALVALRIGHGYDSSFGSSGNGYFVGAAYRELLGARFAGLTIGYAINMETHRP